MPLTREKTSLPKSMRGERTLLTGAYPGVSWAARHSRQLTAEASLFTTARHFHLGAAAV
jgi:hypothetical protein